MPRSKRRRRRSKQQRRIIIAVGAAVVVVIVVAGAWLWFGTGGTPAADLGSHLESLGFTLNPGLDATFTPGTVIQTTEAGANGPVPLKRPVVLVRGEQCFPGLEPSSKPLPLLTRTGQRTGSLALDASDLARFLPALGLAGKGLKRYSLAVKNPRVLSCARAELSEHFAEVCVDAFAQALAAGDQPEWFATIIEAVIADGISITIEWQATTEAEARAELTSKARTQLETTTAEVLTELTAHDRTVLETEQTIVLAFRTRPMEPVKDQ